MNGKTLATEPIATDRCSSGVPTSFTTTSTGWSWKCEGSSGASIATCSATKLVAATTPAALNGTCSSINGKTSDVMLSGNLCATGNQTTVVETASGWGWKCEGLNGGSGEYCIVNRYVAQSNPTVNVNTGTSVSGGVNTGSQTSSSNNTATNNSNTNTSTISKTAQPDNSNNAGNVATEKISSTQVIQESATLPNQENLDDSIKALDAQQPVSSQNAPSPMIAIEKSQVITPSTIIEAKNLQQDNNPKLSGVVDKALIIENVKLNKQENGINNVHLSGKAQPNALVTIYIFSNDPVVITVKADANGDWNYELDKELADGQHEAYVAVADSAGKVISKSEPIAFVKTAQAATVIPVSRLTANQSPIQQSSQQYILIAIMIMSVCLAIALALIGFLNHQRNLNEGINQ